MMSTPSPVRGAAIGMLFDDFFRSEYPRLVPMLHGVVGDRGQAEDLAQEALAIAQREWGKVSGYELPGAWVRRVALNRASNVRRRRDREVVALRRAGDPEPTVEEPAAVDTHLWRLVSALPLRQRGAVALHYIEDRPLHEVAEILECSEGSVKTHLSRARETLARQLDVSRKEATP
jgi:RNA polymerase sigma-70 factor (ECF subfamily)